MISPPPQKKKPGLFKTRKLYLKGTSFNKITLWCCKQQVTNVHFDSLKKLQQAPCNSTFFTHMLQNVSLKDIVQQASSTGRKIRCISKNKLKLWQFLIGKRLLAVFQLFRKQKDISFQRSKKILLVVSKKPSCGVRGKCNIRTKRKISIFWQKKCGLSYFLAVGKIFVVSRSHSEAIGCHLTSFIQFG